MSQRFVCGKRKSVQPSIIETRDLIKLVKDRRCLWDRSNHDYRDRYLKDAAWLEIFKAVEPDYDHLSEDLKNLVGSKITKKWHNVRDTFVKSKKQGTRNKPYIYSKLLDFLEPVYIDDKEKADENDQWLNEEYLVEENEAKRQKVDLERSEREDNITSVLVNLLNREEDEDRAFFTSITPAVKKLSAESKIEFRIEVMKLIKNLRDIEKTTSTLKSEVYDDEDSQSD